MTLKYHLGLFALALFAVPATAASAYYEDTTPPATQVTTPEGTVLMAAEDAVEGTSEDDMSGIYNVYIDFCSTDSAECTSVEDAGSDCSWGCPLSYDWSVVVPDELPPGQYIVSAYAVDDAGNWEDEGSSILVTVL